MNENIRTLIFAGTAAVLVALAYFTLPGRSTIAVSTREGKELFDKFSDPTKAASIEITRYNDTTSEIESLKVEKAKGRWVIPSHHHYPADAQNQLRDTAASLLGVKALGLATEIPEQHEQFGVLDPSTRPEDSTKKGYGTLVVIRDEKREDLARVVIGEKVKDNPDQRFVRIAEGGNLGDQVYVAKIDMEKLPTEFNKWIEQDLLKVNPIDIASLTLKDYSIVKAQDAQGREGYVPQQRMEASVAWDNLASEWAMKNFLLYKENEAHPAGLGEGEELNKQKLDDLKSALDELKIEDVRRKPAGLGSIVNPDEKLLADPKMRESLEELGFIAGRLKNRLEIYSSNGEVVVDLKDGVRYLLRFGKPAGIQAGTEGKKLNRYLLVTAQVAEELLSPPVLEPEPAGPEVPPPTTPPAPEEKPKASGGACTGQEEEAKPKSEETKPAKTGEAKSDATKSAPPSETKTKGKADVPPPETPSTKPDPAKAELERIRKANQRKLEEYNEKLKKAEGRVAELNARFSDWYYIISEDTYKKIHLGRADIIREGATAKETGFGVDAFRKLEKDGLKKTPPPGAPSSGLPGGLPPGLPGGFGPPPM